MGARERSIREMAQEIRELMAADLGQAMRAAKRASKRWPDSPALLSLKAEILLERGELESAAQAIALAERCADLDIKSRLRLIEACVTLGRFEQAFAMIKAALKTRPEPELVLRLASSLIDIGEYAQAAAVLAKAVGGSSEPRRLQLLERACQGQAADARDGVEPEGKRQWSVAMEQLRAGRPGRAETRFQALVERWPRYAPAWLGQRGALEAKGRPDEAAAVQGRWSAARPSAGAVIGAGMGRSLGPRGLLFDPHEPLPIRPRSEALERIETPDALQSAHNAWLPLGAGGETFVHAPAFAFDRLHPEPVEVRSIAPETFVASIRNAMLVGRGVVVCEDGSLVEELTYLNPAKYDARPSEGGVLFDPRTFRDGLCPIRVFEEPALLLAGPTDRSFGDWIINFPPRLALAEAARLDCKVVLADEAAPTAVPMLAALGIDPGRLIRHDSSGVSLFPKLYVPSWPMMERLNHMPDPFAVYRRAARQAPAERRRIYLSREGIGNRPMLNESEVRALFERHGFLAVRPETLSFEEALELFAGPACVAAPYGSALLNLVFASARAPCMVIAPPEPELFLREAISWLGAMGLPFGYVRGEAGPDPSRRNGWIAPLELVEQGLQALLALAD
jgi:tetratricopeptide (TPR) repeat protein